MKQTKKKKRKKPTPMIPAAEGLHATAEPKDMVLNTQVRDSSSKTIFDNHILYSQFLRDYVDLPYLKDVRPEDIEDVSAQYVTLFAEERNSDRVKRVHIHGGDTPFFLVSLIEHKTKPDYNVCMQIFRYMVYIWNAYEKEAESIQKGMAKRADFLYPPILPIVYYEGSKEWSVPLNFRSRIREGKAFGKYLPDFEYYLVPLKDYSNEALMENRDEISLVMLINKLQTAEDIENFRKLPGREIESILQDSPEHLVDTIADVLKAFLLKMNVPVPDTEKLTDKVREKKMAELFADMDKMDIQAEWKKTAEANKRADEAERRADKAEKLAAEAQRHVSEIQKQLQTQLQDMQKQVQKQIQKQTQELEEKLEENSIKSLVELCQKLGTTKASAIENLMEQKPMNPEKAREKVELYWKHSP